ncbi:GTP cyclohydrolase 1 [Hypoxylon texense]
MSAGTRSKSASVRGNEPAGPNTHQALREWQESQQSPNQPAWNSARLALRITSTVFAVALLGVSLSGFAAPRGFSSFPLMGAPLAIAALLFDMAGFIVTCVRKRKAGMRPAVSLGFELIISLGGIPISTLLVFFTVDSWNWHLYYDGRPGTPVPNYVSNGYFWFGMSLATSILAIFLTQVLCIDGWMLIHFVLFVRDCVEVDRERKATRRFLRKVASKDPAPRRESTFDRPVPPYSMVELESQPESSQYDTEPSKHVTSKSAYVEDSKSRLYDVPLEPKSLG